MCGITQNINERHGEIIAVINLETILYPSLKNGLYPNMLFYDYLKIQQLKANEHQLFKLKEDVSETQKKMSEIERLKHQFKDQSLTLHKIEMENLNLAQQLHKNLEEMKSITKERDQLKLERDQLKEDLQKTIARVSWTLSTYPVNVFLIL